MRTIHKFEILICTETQDVTLPDEHQFLAVEYIIPKRAIYVWFEVTTDLTAEKNTRKLRVFKSGDGIPDNYEYLGTTIDQYLPESYHVYMVRQ